jgi:tetratricopeptide (TPR) repeat protein
MEGAMQPKCQKCGMAFDLTLEGKNENVIAPACIRCGAPLLSDSSCKSIRKIPSHPLKGMPSVLSMSEKDNGRKDYMAIGIVIAILLLILFSGFYVLKNFQTASINKSIDSITNGMDDLLYSARQQVENLFQMVDPRKPKSSSAKQLVRQGYDFYMKNHFQKAMDSLNQAIDKDSENPEAYYWRGRTLVKLGRRNLAVQNFQKAIIYRSDYWQAHDNLGWLYMRQGDFDACLVHLNRSIVHKPDNGWAFYNRAYVHDRLGNRGKAIADAKKACGLKNQKGCDLLDKYKRESGNGQVNN